MSGPERFRGVLDRVLGAFGAIGIRWCLTGSTVGAHYGVPRATMDVDVVAEMRPVHVRPLCESMDEDYLRRWARELGVPDLLEAALEGRR